MKKTIDNKCSSCGYSLVFSPKDQALKCPQCENLVFIPSKKLAEKKEYNPQSKVERDKDTDFVHECASCGAKTKVDANGVTGVCPYCGSSNLNQLAESIEYKPDAIVPFQITKEQAILNYKQWLSTRKFVPKKLQDLAKVNKMEGLYVPCWDFDFNVNSLYKGVGIEEHRRTRYRTNSDGQRESYTETYETRHPFSGTRFDSFNDYVYSGSKTILQNELESLGNFGLENLKVYNTAYLVGFLSSSFDVDMHKSFENVTYDAKQEVVSRVKREHSYDDYEDFKVTSTFNSIMWRYIYLPVYVCNFDYNKKKYRFLVNGYTGYVKGKVPRSGWKIFGLVAGIMAIVGAFVWLVANAS